MTITTAPTIQTMLFMDFSFEWANTRLRLQKHKNFGAPGRI